MNEKLPEIDALWDYGDPAASERRFRELLTAVRHGRAPADQAELLSQIARAQGLQRQFDQAHATLDQADELIAGAGAEQPTARARVRGLLERGRVFNSAGDRARATPLFEAALELARACREDYLAVDAAHMLAIAAPPERQLEWNLRALTLAERSDQPRAKQWFGSLYNNIGWAYHDAGEYERALDMFEKALSYRKERGDAEQVRVARWCVARGQRSLGRLAEALAAQRELLAELEQAGATDGYVHEELGECLLALGNAGEARAHFARAYAELAKDEWLAESEPGRLKRLAELGETK